ncbi:MAG: LUD domain-containing protein [Cyclobacteriaceae bacterium]|nr:LUD domain-containing protein [Cyclobacteriaceae bacterium]
MNSREQILNAIRSAKPSADAAVSYTIRPVDVGDIIALFESWVTKNGGRFFRASGIEEAAEVIKREYPSAYHIISTVDGIEGSRPVRVEDDPHTLADVDLAVVQGEVGVAENAAIWLSESRLVKRVLPFIAQDLAILIREKDIVANLHEAYARISVAEEGYGVFVSAPSKTADIEQSLVIGAHGPRSLSVILMP